MTTHPNTHPERPGAVLTSAGLGLGVLGLLLFVIGINGPIAGPALVLVLLGMGLATVGFARRLLAALEDKR